MYQTWIEIGATPHAEAAHEFEHEATKKTIDLSKQIVNWKEGAKVNVHVRGPKGGTFIKSVRV
jgi:hypothetical protein